MDKEQLSFNRREKGLSQVCHRWRHSRARSCHPVLAFCGNTAINFAALASTRAKSRCSSLTETRLQPYSAGEHHITERRNSVCKRCVLTQKVLGVLSGKRKLHSRRPRICTYTVTLGRVSSMVGPEDIHSSNYPYDTVTVKFACNFISYCLLLETLSHLFQTPSSSPSTKTWP